MCIIGCAPKARFYEEFYSKLNDNKLTLNDLKKDKTFFIDETDIPIRKIVEGLDDNLSEETEGSLKFPVHSWDATINKEIRELIKKVGFSKNDYIYQGCLIYVKGKVKDIEKWDHIASTINFAVYHGREDLKPSDSNFPYSLRPSTLTKLEQGDLNFPETIKLLFVFSHNSKIKGYFYARDDWIHIMDEKMSLKFLKQNKNLNYEDEIDNTKIFYIQEIDDITDEFKKKVMTIDNDNQKKLNNQELILNENITPICILVKDNNLIEEITTKFNKEKLVFVECSYM